jgi:hypothetical protein
MIKRIIAAISILFIASTASAADTPSVRATVSKRTVNIGDRIRYRIEVTYHEGTKISFPASADNKIGEFEIKDSGKSVKNGWFGRITASRWYDIAVYSVGKFSIPETQVYYTVKGDPARKSLTIKAMEISVESVIPKGAAVTDIKDIKPPIPVRETGRKVTIALLLAASFAAAIYAYRKIRNRKPVKLPHETAMEELEAIKAQFLRSGDVKAYFVGVSDSVRRYIEHTFDLRAPEMTTEEFLESLKTSGSLSQEQKGPLKDFMHSCDLVKFAKYSPSKEEAELVFTTAAKFIEETKDVHI